MYCVCVEGIGFWFKFQSSWIHTLYMRNAKCFPLSRTQYKRVYMMTPYSIWWLTILIVYISFRNTYCLCFCCCWCEILGYTPFLWVSFLSDGFNFFFLKCIHIYIIFASTLPVRNTRYKFIWLTTNLRCSQLEYYLTWFLT